MQDIIVVTGNSRKVSQVKTAIEPLGINVSSVDATIHEIQEPDGDIHGVEVAREKAKAAFDIVKKPLIICDQYWEIPALGGFPGAYMKDADKFLEPKHFLAMLDDADSRTILLYENVVYTDGEITKDFTAKYSGHLAKEPRGSGQASGRLIVYDGTDLTIAEHRARGEHARDMEKSAWKMFGEWYISEPIK